jgi:hypothetical protein
MKLTPDRADPPAGENLNRKELSMKDYNYWLIDWPKIVTQTFAHGGRMFEVAATRSENGMLNYVTGHELTIDEALANADPDKRLMTLAVFKPQESEATRA